MSALSYYFYDQSNKVTNISINIRNKSLKALYVTSRRISNDVKYNIDSMSKPVKFLYMTRLMYNQETKRLLPQFIIVKNIFFCISPF